ncbi:MAG: hypothetical protein HRT35_26060 [Algicola sp.]|nr:hypothetical protein [Algicola sp.]
MKDKRMHLKNLFTEFDDSISQSLNIDPLGMTVIWSVFGQKIFNRRVSSISNDVRNYTLNLLHHLVIKEVVEDSTQLSLKLTRVYQQKDSFAFKQACLIHCENLFVYSMLGATNEVNTLGVLGASKGRVKWQEKHHNPELIFSHTKKSNLLIRQLTLGVSGRYKTPFMEMKFFDNEYRYKHPDYQVVWQQTQVFINRVDELKTVKDELKKHLIGLIKSNDKLPNIRFSTIANSLRVAYTTAFSSGQKVGLLTKDFWLSITDLNRDAAGKLYDVISTGVEDTNCQQLFEQALKTTNEVAVKSKFEHIIALEPFLAECELLFTLLTSMRNQTLAELLVSYKALERPITTLPDLARRLVDKVEIKDILKGTGAQRYQSLLKFSKIPTKNETECFEMVVKKLLEYHKSIMNARGQSPWVEQINAGYRCNIKLTKVPSAQKRPLKSWYHRYYINEFKYLISGLEGEVA